MIFFVFSKVCTVPWTSAEDWVCGALLYPSKPVRWVLFPGEIHHRTREHRVPGGLERDTWSVSV